MAARMLPNCRAEPIVVFILVSSYFMPCIATRPIQQQAAKNVSSDSYGGSSFGTFIESLQFLFPQNYARAKVGVFPLLWDYKVESYARWWAEQRKVDCQMIHSHGPYGENIFWGTGQDWTPLDAVKFWVDEKQYYSYANNTCDGNEMCGHYTQIVWRDSRRLGCARIVCDNGNLFMTCNYDPPGNYIGERPY
eukprot:Gb_11042 [translate_table: standard]